MSDTFWFMFSGFFLLLFELFFYFIYTAVYSKMHVFGFFFSIYIPAISTEIYFRKISKFFSRKDNMGLGRRIQIFLKFLNSFFRIKFLPVFAFTVSESYRNFHYFASLVRLSCLIFRNSIFFQ